MFGYVMANLAELDKQQKQRYSAVYCGICRRIRTCASNTARLGLSYDMAFLALLLMSLYEPEETQHNHACMLHPARHWTDSPIIAYAADMNVALAYYNCLDDYEDDGKFLSGKLAGVFGKALPEIRERWPRQCEAIESCIAQLSRMERENCQNPDEPAGCFGKLMGELLVWQEDMWSESLRQMGMALGRYIYLADAAVDFRKDSKKHNYNPFIAAGMQEDWAAWEQYLIMAMGRCTAYYECLPLVQDKRILDNILYSGVWIAYRRKTGRKQNEKS